MRKVALLDLNIAKSVIRHGEIALPTGVGGIGFRQPCADRQAGAVGHQSSGEVKLRYLDVTYFDVRAQRSRCQPTSPGPDFARSWKMSRAS